MTADTIGALSVKRQGRSFFATVEGINLATDLNKAWDDIRASYLDHKILSFHGQSLTAAQFHDLGRRFVSGAAIGRGCRRGAGRRAREHEDDVGHEHRTERAGTHLPTHGAAARLPRGRACDRC